MPPINYLAVLVAGFVAYAIGFLWYGPIFGKIWMKLEGINPQKVIDGKKNGMAATYALSFLSTLVMAYVLAHSLLFASTYLNVSGAGAGVSAAFWNWLGYVVPTSLGTVFWNGKSWKAWGLTAAYYLVALVAMGIILALWQ